MRELETRFADSGILNSLMEVRYILRWPRQSANGMPCWLLMPPSLALLRVLCEYYRRPFYDQGKFAQTIDDDAARQGWCLFKLGCNTL